jgi:hypothetical protein
MAPQRLCMIDGATRRHVVAVLLAGALLTCRAGLVSAEGAAGAPAAEQPNQDAYRQRMQAGVRLYKSQDFRGALAEFEAAYQLSPRASPLINISLCQRALFRYPRAITALELALSKHRDSLEAADEAAARRAIDEMRALVGALVVRGLPEGAELRIEDEEYAVSAEPITLSPGSYTVTASAPGHTPRSQEVVIVGGARVELELQLAAAMGTLTIIAADKLTPILVDGKRVGRGSYHAQVPVGPHTIELLGETEPSTIEVRSNETSRFESPLRAVDAASLPPVPAGPTRGEPPPPEPPRRGFYALIGGAVLFPLRHPDYFGKLDRDSASSGASVAARAGYLVHTHAGFELFAEYNNVVGPANGTEAESYTLSSWRVGPLLRLQSGGDILRFVGTIGGGFAVNFIDQELASGLSSSSGVDFFAVSELGAELDLDGVLVHLALAGYLSGTKGMNDFDGAFASRDRELQEPYGNTVLPSLGPRLSIGYAFW